MQQAPPLILELVRRFSLNKDHYLSQNYNEEQVRHEFINPMFELLGWDMTNQAGVSDAYKDVVYEEAIKVGAPDYCFRLGSLRKFFVEAKAPRIDIPVAWQPAVQLRSYAWSAKLTLSVLTNFAHFAAYDGRIPIRTQMPKASEARVMLIPYTDYPTRWSEIESVFSKESVWKGLFDRYAESKTPKRGTAPVDEEFLAQMSNWRERLAWYVRRDNPALTGPQLNFAVQMTIDRIVFLRIAEDRGIETYAELQRLSKANNVYSALLQHFEAADTKYNSGIFHFRKEQGRSSAVDELTPGLQIKDEILRQIIGDLYPPASHYRFSHVPSEILGQVYEQFLGKVIVLTEKTARVEEKPEVRKAGGVYYTPAYVVDYIVNNTLGTLLPSSTGVPPVAGAAANPPLANPKSQIANPITPAEAAKLRILDPACGSGSFLLGAYQKLLDWHLDHYYHHGPEALCKKKNPPIRQIAATDPALFGQPSYRLTISERKRILVNNIYGVDIDPQAVEVTKLSLLLKCLEGESAETLQPVFRFMHERALTDLDDNIKCGNSLIAHDCFDARRFPQHRDLPEPQRARINAFDWNAEFPRTMKSGGFDVVLGNPPYLFITEVDEHEKRYFADIYRTCQYRFDVYGLFIEQAVRRQLRPGGMVSFIIPHTLLSNDSFEKLRRLLLDETHLHLVTDIGPGIFAGAKNETMIFVARKPAPNESLVPCHVVHTSAKARLVPRREFTVDQLTWRLNPGAAWAIQQSDAEAGLIARISDGKVPMGEICTINQGLRTGDNDRYLSRKRPSSLWKHAVGGKDVGRYEPLRNGTYVYYKPEALDAPRNPAIFESRQKLVVQEIRNITLPRRIIATYDDRRFYCLQSTNVINVRPEATEHWPILYVLAILNSALMNFFFRQRFPGNNHIASNQLAQIPFVPFERAAGQPLIDLATRILATHRKLAVAKLPTDRTRLHREIAATDEQLDRLVYDLYALSDAEVRIVEGAAA